MEEIVKQNKINKIDESSMVVISMRLNKKHNDVMVLLQVDSKTHRHQLVSVENYVGVLRCLKRYGFSHKASKFKNVNKVCSRC